MPHRKYFLFVIALLMVGQLSAQSRLDSLKKELSTYNRMHGTTPVSLKDTVKLKLLDGLARISSETDPVQALQFAAQQLELAKKMKYNPGMAPAYDNLGFVNQIQGNLVEAIAHFKRMMYWNNKVRDKAGEVAAANSLGQIYAETLNVSQAIKYFLHGLSLSKAAGDKKGIATSYNNIGVLYRQNGDSGKALENYLIAGKLMAELDNKPAQSMLNHNIGQIYWEMDEPEKAIQSMKKGLQIAQEIGDVRAEFRNWNGLGFIYGDLGKTDLALDCFRHALKINQDMGNVRGIVASYLSIGRVYYQKSDFDKALEYGKKGLQQANAADDLRQKNNAYDLLSKIYEGKKDFQKAFDFHVLHKDMNDSIVNVDKSENIESLKLRYDLKSSQDSIAAIQVKKDVLAEAKIATQKKTRNFVYIVLSIIVVFLIILIWQRNKIAIIRREKALEQERNRISRDLHDNLGAQLSTVRMFVSSLKNDKNEHTSDIIDNSVGLLDSSIGELRGIMHEMQNPVLLEKGYLLATEELINGINLMHSVRFELTYHNMEPRPRPELEHQLYRITQELVNNTLKYADAKQVSIDILRRDGKLFLMYEDDGVGYDFATVEKGYGLRNIELRAKAIGGKVEFDSMPNAGARTIIEIPE